MLSKKQVAQIVIPLLGFTFSGPAQSVDAQAPSTVYEQSNYNFRYLQFHHIDALGHTELVNGVTNDILRNGEYSPYSSIFAGMYTRNITTCDAASMIGRLYYGENWDQTGYDSFAREVEATKMLIAILIKLQAEVGIGTIEDAFPVVITISDLYEESYIPDARIAVSLSPIHLALACNQGGGFYEPHARRVRLPSTGVIAFAHEWAHYLDYRILDKDHAVHSTPQTDLEMWASIYDVWFMRKFFGITVGRGGYNPSAALINGIAEALIEQDVSISELHARLLSSTEDFSELLGHTLKRAYAQNSNVKWAIDLHLKSLPLSINFGDLTDVDAGHLIQFLYIDTINYKSRVDSHVSSFSYMDTYLPEYVRQIGVYDHISFFYKNNSGNVSEIQNLIYEKAVDLLLSSVDIDNFILFSESKFTDLGLNRDTIREIIRATLNTDRTITIKAFLASFTGDIDATIKHKIYLSLHAYIIEQGIYNVDALLEDVRSMALSTDLNENENIRNIRQVPVEVWEEIKAYFPILFASPMYVENAALNATLTGDYSSLAADIQRTLVNLILDKSTLANRYAKSQFNDYIQFNAPWFIKQHSLTSAKIDMYFDQYFPTFFIHSGEILNLFIFNAMIESPEFAIQTRG